MQVSYRNAVRHVRWCNGGAAEGVILEALPLGLNSVSLPLFERTLEVRRKLKVSAHIRLAA
jgi:hypothetical protein